MCNMLICFVNIINISLYHTIYRIVKKIHDNNNIYRNSYYIIENIQ